MKLPPAANQADNDAEAGQARLVPADVYRTYDVVAVGLVVEFAAPGTGVAARLAVLSALLKAYVAGARG